MNELKPNIEQMIELGKGCGLLYLEEAYSNYMNHYDCFFLVEKYKEQYHVFLRDMAIAGLLVEDSGDLMIADILLSDI